MVQRALLRGIDGAAAERGWCTFFGRRSHYCQLRGLHSHYFLFCYLFSSCLWSIRAFFGLDSRIVALPEFWRV
jgi:hypothetical protein